MKTAIHKLLLICSVLMSLTSLHANEVPDRGMILKGDFKQVQALVDKAEQAYGDKKFNQALKLFKQAKDTLEPLHGEQHESIRYIVWKMALVQRDAGNIPAAVSMFDHAATLEKSINGKHFDEKKAEHNKLNFYWLGGEHEYDKAEAIKNFWSFKKVYAYNRSLAWFSKYATLALKAGKKRNASNSYYMMTKILNHQGQFEDAAKYARLTLDINKVEWGEQHDYTIRARKKLADIYFEWGESRNKKKDYAEAINYFNQALPFFKASGQEKSAVYTQEWLSDDYLAIGDFAKALEARNVYIKYFEGTSENNQANKKLAEIHVAWAGSLIAKHAYTEADVHTQLALKLAAQSDLTLKEQSEWDIHQKMADAYLEAGQIADAIYHQKVVYQHYKDLKKSAAHAAATKTLFAMYSKAEEFEKAIALHPAFMGAWDQMFPFGMVPKVQGELMLAILQMKAGDGDASLALLNHIIESAPKAAPKRFTFPYMGQVTIEMKALTYKAALQRESGHPQEALKTLAQGKKVSDDAKALATASGMRTHWDRQEAIYQSGLALMQTGEDQQALALLNKVLEMKPAEQESKPLEYIRKLNSLRSLYQKMGNTEAASSTSSTESAFVEKVFNNASEKTSRWFHDKLGKRCSSFPACTKLAL